MPVCVAADGSDTYTEEELLGGRMLIDNSVFGQTTNNNWRNTELEAKWSSLLNGGAMKFRFSLDTEDAVFFMHTRKDGEPNEFLFIVDKEKIMFHSANSPTTAPWYEQAELAHEVGLPICIHNRDSIGDCLEILKEHKHLLSNSGVVHCFSESVEIYKEIKKLGLKIAFGGTLTFKNSVQAPAVCEIADLEDILIETDCPYLTPHPYRGKINEPKYTSLVAQKIAEIKKISYDSVVDQTTKNALQLFTKVDK